MTLGDKLKGISELIAKNEEDRNKVKKWWPEKIQELYKNIEEWIEPYIQKEWVTIEYQEIEKFEKQFGSYITNKMILNLPDHSEYVFDPFAHFVIEGYGRVDFYSRGKRSKQKKIVLIGESRERAKWNIVSNSYLTKSIPLTLDSFEKILSDCIEE